MHMYLYAVIGESNNSYNVVGSGQPWRQQYEINKDQSVQLNNWSTGIAFPISIHASHVIVTKNRVYLLGGRTTSNISSVYTAIINTDGSLGAWTTGTALPGALSGSQAIVTKNRVYLLGGNDASTTISTIYTAPINSDGTLGTWVSGGSLPGTLCWSQAIVTDTNVYLLGGSTNGTNAVSTVYFTTINSDGTLNTWSTGTSLPGNLSHSQSVITKNRIYLLGGLNGSDYVSTVYTAPIDSSGTIGTWVTGTNLPVALHASQSIVTRNRVYLLGGWSGNVVSTIYSAVINKDGTLGTWGLDNNLPNTLSHTSVFTTKNFAFIIGGWTGSSVVSTIYYTAFSGGLNDYSAYYSEDTTNYMMPGSGRPWQQQYQINTSQTGNLTGWTASQTLPIAIGRANFVVTKNRVYMIGGYDASGPVASVFTATINTDGSLGAWTSTTPLPTELDGASVIVFKNRVYLIGGYNHTILLATVHVAPINADGTLGTWSTTTSLPIPLHFHASLVTKNRLYVLGGVTTGLV